MELLKNTGILHNTIVDLCYYVVYNLHLHYKVVAVVNDIIQKTQEIYWKDYTKDHNMHTHTYIQCIYIHTYVRTYIRTYIYNVCKLL